MNESKKKDRYEDAKKFVRYSDGAKMYSMGRIINHRGREVRPYPQKAKRGDSASDNSEGRRETHFVARL